MKVSLCIISHIEVIRKVHDVFLFSTTNEKSVFDFVLRKKQINISKKIDT